MTEEAGYELGRYEVPEGRCVLRALRGNGEAIVTVIDAPQDDEERVYVCPWAGCANREHRINFRAAVRR